MQPIEIIAIIAAVVLVAQGIIFSVIRRRKNKGSCSGGCAGCPLSKNGGCKSSQECGENEAKHAPKN